MNLYKKALRIARRAHEGQKRKDGEDYINHPIRVAKAVEKKCSGEFRDKDAVLVVKTVAVLHDVLEDSDITLEQIAEELNFYDFRLAIVLPLLTRDKRESYLDYILNIKDIPLARMIKLADIEDNLGPAAKGTLRDKYLLAKYILEV